MTVFGKPIYKQLGINKTLACNFAEQQTERQMKKNESNIQDLWINIKHPNIYIRGVPKERKERRRSKCI